LKKKYSQIQDQIKKNSLFLKKLKNALIFREQSLNLFLQSQALKCDMNFTSYLQSRNYIGRLNFSHDNLTLDVVVHTNKSREAKKSTDLKSLSGGERSFSTVAFLLALWSTVESPILFLDEFDVFMVSLNLIIIEKKKFEHFLKINKKDQLNRNYAISLITDAAKSKLTSQYVFLTPQEMG
jgi:chromosome segregation ATPase